VLPGVVPVRNCGAQTEHTPALGGVRWHLARFSMSGERNRGAVAVGRADRDRSRPAPETHRRSTGPCTFASTRARAHGRRSCWALML
jgi:hypothetical protein